MNITERASLVLQQIDADLALAWLGGFDFNERGIAAFNIGLLSITAVIASLTFPKTK